jgi:co-chaperonin GroES (HSP10)
LAPRPALVSTESLLTNANHVAFKYDSIAEAFPEVDPGLKPVGAVVLVQVRHPKRKTAGGLHLVAEARSTEHYNTQVAKVIALGPLCFKTVKEVKAREGEVPRDVTVPYVEGPWFEIGNYVRIPKYGGDRFEVGFERVEMETNPETDKQERVTAKDNVIFALFKAKDILGVITVDPRSVKSFLD